jgi:hypothetical protein
MEKRFKIIETPDYYLAVSSDEEIKESDYLYFWNGQSGTIHKLKENQSSDNMYGSGLKIIAYQPKGNAPELDLPLLPEVEDDVDYLADKWSNFERASRWGKIVRDAFKAGHKTATKVYSEEDLREAFNAGYDLNTWEQLEIPNKERDYLHEDDYIQSLKQPKAPKWFVAETERKLVLNLGIEVFNPNTHVYVDELKTTTINGKTYLVGTYLNE